MDITRELAIQILKYCNENHEFETYFPFMVVCKEYSDEDDDFVEIEPNEWETISSDEKYKTFQLWENLQNLDSNTTKLLLEGFIKQIINNETEERSFLLYTNEGFTFFPRSENDVPEIENLQVLGCIKALNSEDAFKKLLSENEYLDGSNFDEIVAVELKDENKYDFSIRNEILDKIRPTTFSITAKEVDDMARELIHEEALEKGLLLSGGQIKKILDHINCDEFLAKDIRNSIKDSILEVIENENI